MISSFCPGGSCVDIQFPEGADVLIVNTARPAVAVSFTRDEWDAFVRGVKAGEFDGHQANCMCHTGACALAGEPFMWGTTRVVPRCNVPEGTVIGVDHGHQAQEGSVMTNDSPVHVARPRPTAEWNVAIHSEWNDSPGGTAGWMMKIKVKRYYDARNGSTVTVGRSDGDPVRMTRSTARELVSVLQEALDWDECDQPVTDEGTSDDRVRASGSDRGETQARDRADL